MSRMDVIRELFNDPVEVHAFVHGLYRALITANPWPNTPDGQEELHYWRAGYLVGKAIHVVGLLIIANHSGLSWY